MTYGQKIQNLEMILENLQNALALYKQNPLSYDGEIATLETMIADINEQLMEV